MSCGQTQKPAKTDWKEENLKGQVKFIYEKKFYLDSIGVLRDSSMWNNIDSLPELTIEFNNEGFSLKRINLPCFFGGGSTIYEYSEINACLLKILSGQNFGIGSAVTTLEYDSKGRLKRAVKRYADNGDSSVVKFDKYDRRGNILKEIFIGIKNTSDYYVTRKYDRFNQIIEENEFDLDDNKRKSVLINKYDVNGNKVYSEFYKLDSTWGYTSKQSFDEYGNVLKRESVYNDNGKVWLPGVDEFKYEYDNIGNWTQMVRKKSGKDKEITRRKIIYW